jgi:hypothetical protein
LNFRPYNNRKFRKNHTYFSRGGSRPTFGHFTTVLADNGSRHLVVINKVDTEKEILFYHDPYDGAEKVANWGKFSAAWDGPVYQADPIQLAGHAFWGMSLTL